MFDHLGRDCQGCVTFFCQNRQVCSQCPRLSPSSNKISGKLHSCDPIALIRKMWKCGYRTGLIIYYRSFAEHCLRYNNIEFAHLIYLDIFRCQGHAGRNRPTGKNKEFRHHQLLNRVNDSVILKSVCQYCNLGGFLEPLGRFQGGLGELKGPRRDRRGGESSGQISSRGLTTRHLWVPPINVCLPSVAAAASRSGTPSSGTASSPPFPSSTRTTGAVSGTSGGAGDTGLCRTSFLPSLLSQILIFFSGGEDRTTGCCSDSVGGWTGCWLTVETRPCSRRKSSAFASSCLSRASSSVASSRRE